MSPETRLALARIEAKVVRNRRKLDRLLALLETLVSKETAIMKTITDLTAAVEAETSLDASLGALIDGAAQQIKDAATAITAAAGDQAAIDAAVTAMQANAAALSAKKDELGAALIANTALALPAPPAA